jgi:hypothetical protein
MIILNIPSICFLSCCSLYLSACGLLGFVWEWALMTWNNYIFVVLNWDMNASVSIELQTNFKEKTSNTPNQKTGLRCKEESPSWEDYSEIISSSLLPATYSLNVCKINRVKMESVTNPHSFSILILLQLHNNL